MNDAPANKKRLGPIFYLLLFISLATFVFCVGGLIREAYVQFQGRSYYDELISEIGTALESEENAQDSLPAGNADETEAAVEMNAEKGAAAGVKTARALNLAALQENLPNLRAWLRCENTALDFPVVQADDNEYYLDHLPNSTKNKLGSIFLDYRNAADFSDQNSLIYGHHIKSGAMFGALKYYKAQSYYNKHPQMRLYTLEQNYVLDLIGAYVADATRETLKIRFADAAEFELYIDEVRRRSFFVSNVEISADDRLVTLCTCSYELDNARFVLVAKLVEVDS